MPDETARERLERRVQDLCAPGHRGSATAAERGAAGYLASELRGMGLEPELQPFHGLTTAAWRLLLPVLAAALGLALLWLSPWITVGLGALALASLFVEQTSRGKLLCRLLPRRPSQNVAARVPARGQAVRRVVVLGHYDTQRTGWIFREGIVQRMGPLMDRCPGLMKSPLFLPQLAMLTQLVAGVVAVVRPGSALVDVALVAGAVVYGITIALLLQWSWSPYGPGAADNATGTAAVLTLGERWLELGDERPEGVELTLLLTGSEETGLLGAEAWAEAHGAELPTRFLNLDTLGHGRPRFAGREHSITGWPIFYPPEALLVCQEAAERLQLLDAGPKNLPLPSDALALLVRGIPGASLICFGDRMQMPNYHQQADTPDRVDFDVTWRGVELGWEVLLGLARD